MPKTILDALHYWQNLHETDIYNREDPHPFHVATGSSQGTRGQLKGSEDILALIFHWMDRFAGIPKAFWKATWSQMIVFETYLLYRFFWFPMAAKKGIISFSFSFSLSLHLSPLYLSHISLYILFPGAYVFPLLHQKLILDRGSVLVFLTV